MRLRILALLFLPLLLNACSKQAAQQEITDVREPGEPRRQAPPKMNASQRLGMEMRQPDSEPEGPLGGVTFHHDMPDGWEAAPKTDLRQVNLRMTDAPEVECYFTFLPGGGGGLEANLNRWRSQMGLEALSADAVAALPTKPIFGQPATYIQIDGDFAGMGTDPKPDYRMYGLILTYADPGSQSEQAFFLKMTGPKTVLEGQEEAFDLVASSLHAVAPGEEHTHDHSADDGAMEETAAPASAETAAVATDGFQWTVPEGWAEIESSSMRQANLVITGQDDVECYFTVLGGTGGGLEMNINRWQRQMGQPELSPEAIAALPKHPLLGGEAAFVTIDGTFGGMSGSIQQENFRMYGLARVTADQAFFVKMTGPQGVLEGQEGNFLAFSGSIQPGAAPSPSAAAPAADATAANPYGMADPTPDGGFNPEGLSWTAPEGWQDGGERMMRVVTYEIGKVECYITTLAGQAGGVGPNINRWVAQMGQPELDEAALAALPQIAILGAEGPLAEVAGTFEGMSGGAQEAYKLLGTVVPVGDQTVFVKMTGPEAEVTAQKDNFIAFCASIQL